MLSVIYIKNGKKNYYMTVIFCCISEALTLFCFPHTRCSLSGYILALEVENAEYRKKLEQHFVPMFSALVDALLLRVQVCV